MGKSIASREKKEISGTVKEEPSGLWALAVGMVYVFRTRPGHRIMRELERAVRKYAADPAALWRLVRDGEEVIEVEAHETALLDGERENAREHESEDEDESGG